MIEDFDLDKFNSETYSFLISTYSSDSLFKLSVNSEPSVFSHCFGIFILNNLGKLDLYKNKFDFWERYIISNLKQESYDDKYRFNKVKMQKLCFSLSALFLLNKLNHKFLKQLVIKIIDYDIHQYLTKTGFYYGKSQSGNFSMFFGSLLIFADKFLKINCKNKINQFIELHTKNVDKNGFFNLSKFNHLSFQNFYHQFEIFEYLNLNVPRLDVGINKILSLINFGYRFAPYPGSSGCYDFDAISLILKKKSLNNFSLDDFFNYILEERNLDFGFSESKDIRPISLNTFTKSIIHILLSPNFFILKERITYSLGLMRSAHNRIDTGWTKYSRNWNESNLWDTWLKIQIIYKILVYKKNKKINFIDFPGMGFYNHL